MTQGLMATNTIIGLGASIGFLLWCRGLISLVQYMGTGVPVSVFHTSIDLVFQSVADLGGAALAGA